MAAAGDSVAARVLVVAHRTAATPRLVEAVRARARAGPCTFPLLAVREAVADGDFHEVIISTLPARVSHWLRRDLPSRVERLGLPVTVVIAQARRGAVSETR